MGQAAGTAATLSLRGCFEVAQLQRALKEKGAVLV